MYRIVTLTVIIFLAIAGLSYAQVTPTDTITTVELINSGVKKYSEKDFNGAIAEFTKAIELDAKNLEAYYNRGICYNSLQDFTNALTDFDKVVEIDPKFNDVYNFRVNIYLKSKDYEKAI
ncbi:MAG: tetratricopeptide repeat protein, partial [Ignavibacteria bacterium]